MFNKLHCYTININILSNSNENFRFLIIMYFQMFQEAGQKEILTLRYFVCEINIIESYVVLIISQNILYETIKRQYM